MSKKSKVAKPPKHGLLYTSLVVLSILFLVSSYFAFLSPVPLFQILRLQYSTSAGDRYYGRVRLWYFYAQSGDWNRAVALENGIDPPDISLYRKANYPPEIKKRLNDLVTKQSKTTDDYIELAKIQASLDKFSDANGSVSQANKLDPIRADTEKLYYQIQSGN